VHCLGSSNKSKWSTMREDLPESECLCYASQRKTLDEP